MNKRHQPTVDEGMQSLRAHVVQTALAARAAHGPDIDLEATLRLLKDGRFVRYPVRVTYDADALGDDEFAWMRQDDEHPRDGFTLIIHPRFAERRRILPLLIAYHLVVVNYGEIVTHEEAELFGATLLGLDQEDYYQTLCLAADSVS